MMPIDHQQQGQGAVLGEFLAHLRPDELDALAGWRRGAGADFLPAPAITDSPTLAVFCSALSGTRIRTSWRGAEILYLRSRCSRPCRAACGSAPDWRLRVVDLDQRAAGELDREVQTAAEEEEHRQQESEQRDDVEHQAWRMKGMSLLMRKNSIFVLPYLISAAPTLAGFQT
jgi:hypothetical protein